ncbi:NADH:ubiquinone reductase (Na(+)-transporting) subunit A, partial [Halobacteriovorax sp. HFRX-2_2]
MIHIKRGLDLPISGKPSQKIEVGPQVTKVALTGPDYVGMKPTMLVQVGDEVKKGQALFSCKKVEGVLYTAPISGKVIEINRGARRAFETLVIEVSGNEQVTFENYKGTGVKDLAKEDVQALLVESGLWPTFRTRPFSKAPALASEPHSIFVTAMDTNPLAADPAVVIAEASEDFVNGVEVISKLTDGRTFVCKAAGANIPTPSTTKVETKEFAGVHPAGNAGTHIHFIDPVSANKTVWSINYQDVIAIGKLFATGELSTERIISIAGPASVNPTLVKTVPGAHLGEVTSGKVGQGEVRVVSGSVFSGRAMVG